MIQFFQSRMGDKFFNSTMIRLVTALEKIADRTDTVSKLETRVIKLELRLLVETLEESEVVRCLDGYEFTLSQGVEEFEYVNFFNINSPNKKDDMLEEYKSCVYASDTYQKVPYAVLEALVIKHGGLHA